MAVTKKEMTDLMWEHKAIRAHMRFLIDSLRNMATQSRRRTVQSARLTDQIRLYRWSLYDFREALRRHTELDERIFQTLRGSISIKDIIKEHDEIRKQVDNATRLAENAVYNKLGREELNQCALNIKETVNRVCELIEAHIDQEDIKLKLLLKDS